MSFIIIVRIGSGRTGFGFLPLPTRFQIRYTKRKNKEGYNSMEILFLGTGHAISTRCYNTCYVLRQNERYLLVDGGGGNGRSCAS